MERRHRKMAIKVYPDQIKSKIIDQNGDAIDAEYTSVDGLKVHVVGDSTKYVQGDIAEGATLGSANPVAIGYEDGSGNNQFWDGSITQGGTWNIGTVTTVTTITNDVNIADGGNSITVDGEVTATPPKAASANLTSKISVGSSSTTLIASNGSRKKLIVVNDSDEDVYVNFSGTAVMNEGIRINKKGGSVTDDVYTGAVTGICTSGSKNVTVTEL